MMDNLTRKKIISSRLCDYGAYSNKDKDYITASALIEQTEVLRDIVKELENIRRELRDLDIGLNGVFR